MEATQPCIPNLRRHCSIRNHSVLLPEKEGRANTICINLTPKLQEASTYKQRAFY